MAASAVRVSRNFLDYEFSDQTNLALLLEEPFPLAQVDALLLAVAPVAFHLGS